MYGIGKKYKIQLNNDIVYTGIILDEDNLQIKIKDKFGDELIITKSSINQSKRVVE